MSKLFKVFGNNDKYNYVEEKNLEKVNCKCGGNLHIVKKDIANYETTTEYLLQCVKCGGKYFATNDESYVPLGEQNERNQPSI